VIFIAGRIDLNKVSGRHILHGTNRKSEILMIIRLVALIGAVSALLLPTAAMAYIGPGAGASLAGSLFGVLAAIATALAIVLFWPLRLMYKKIKGNKQAAPETADASEAAKNIANGAAE
jgi:NADH:ubiquinone oxidoreductase subunit 6 (subunit J)